jgi:hypothetical protein
MKTFQSKLQGMNTGVIKSWNLSVSQGYLFVSNIDYPDLSNIFQDIIKMPVTYIILESTLTT